MSKKLPSVTSDIPRDLRAFIDRVREVLSGNTPDRYVTAREIISSGAAEYGPGGVLATANPAKKTELPAQPQNVAAAGALQNVVLTWDAPNYTGHAYAEILRNSTDDIFTAALITTTPGRVASDSVGFAASFYYWVRFVNTLGVAGPYNSANGVYATSGVDTAFSIQTLSDIALDPTSPLTKFAVRADLFYAAPGMDYNQEATPTATTTGEFWYQPSADLIRVWSGSAWNSFSANLPFIVNTTSQVINGVTVPAGVYMSDAFIQNGTITNAKIGNAAIDDAKISSLSAAKITSGTISAGVLDANVINSKVTNIDAAVIGSGVINSARIGTLSVSSITSGTTTSGLPGGGNFALGGPSSVGGIAATMSAHWNTGSGFGILGTNNSTVGGASGLCGASSATWAVTAYNSTNSSFNVFNTVAGLASGPIAVQGQYHGGLALPLTSPTTEGRLASSGYGALGANYAGGAYGESQLASPGWGAIWFGYMANTSAGYGTFRVGIAEKNGYAVFSWAGSGTAYFTDGVGPFTGVHDGVVENTFSAEPGDILVDEMFLHSVDLSNVIVRVARSHKANQKGAVGVFVAKHETAPSNWQPTYRADLGPAADLPESAKGMFEDVSDEPPPEREDIPNPEYYDIGTQKVVTLNGLGEGLINVCGEGGDIELGDLIVTSSVAGKGMKQADDFVRNTTVAKSRQNVTFSSLTEVKQVACIYMCG